MASTKISEFSWSKQNIKAQISPLEVQEAI